MISVIIPTFNEAETIEKCLKHFKGDNFEVIVIDSPNSIDNISAIVNDFGFQYYKAKKGGRNHQLNEGAKIASGDILYFVHADTQVHHNFQNDIPIVLNEGYDLGCYTYKFSHYPTPLLYINSFFTKLPMIWCRGGDQTLFIKKEVFEALNGFCKNHDIMEDYDIILRSKGSYRFKIIQKNVVVSARKYDKNGYFKVQKTNYITMKNYLNKKRSPQQLSTFYSSSLN